MTTLQSNEIASVEEHRERVGHQLNAYYDRDTFTEQDCRDIQKLSLEYYNLTKQWGELLANNHVRQRRDRLDLIHTHIEEGDNKYFVCLGNVTITWANTSSEAAGMAHLIDRVIEGTAPMDKRARIKIMLDFGKDRDSEDAE